MIQHSAGILAYKYVDGALKVMLAHPGGPFWMKKDKASWSIPKGLLEDGEETKSAAIREFKEEIGCTIEKELIELGSIKQSSGKIITIFTVEMDVDVTKVVSNTFEMEWPPKSGKLEEFPENDRAEWFDIDIARIKIFKGQLGFLDKLVNILNYNEQPEQLSLFD